MKPLSPSPAQLDQPQPPRPESRSLPHWSELPLTRQQELITTLSSLLLRHWPHPSNPPQEVSHDPHR
jgi:hypothetical protein